MLEELSDMNKIQFAFVVFFAIGIVYALAAKVGISLETVLVMAGSILSVSGSGLMFSNKRKEAILTFGLSLAVFGLYFILYYF